MRANACSPPSLKGRCYCALHFLEEETGAQSGHPGCLGWQRQGLCLVLASVFPQIQNRTASQAHSLPSAPLHSHPCFADFAPESPSLNFSMTPLGSWWDRLVPTAASGPLAMAQQALPRDVVLFHSCWQTSAGGSSEPSTQMPCGPIALETCKDSSSSFSSDSGERVALEAGDGRVSCLPELPWG